MMKRMEMNEEMMMQVNGGVTQSELTDINGSANLDHSVREEEELFKKEHNS